ncbi:Z1 domain-containing protein [Brevibacterium sp. HMSC22B09]|uniref:Z1 domain-containing protein n=1 Tax=Brevibacterium sp. HMSC22B09 TaxID=1581055 RepID=UPI0009F19D08|nr:Z1 domain-containing protein [Brevibacterium sp. HMSC22B09]
MMDENERRTIEMVYGFHRKTQNREEAEAATRRQLSTYGKAVLDEFFNELEQLRQKSTTLFVNDISARQDIKERGWYFPDSDGDLWRSLKDKMLDSGLREAVNNIDNESDAIVAASAEPYQLKDRRKGLVIGNVQSGKTANYASVIAKAVDAGYRFIIVLAGLHNNLRGQTQRRLDRDLGVEDGPLPWYRLTSSDSDFGPGDARNAEAMTQGTQPVLAVVKKNSSRLRNLRNFLRQISLDTRESRFPILIIDDESDQATPDSSKEGAQETTAINTLVRQIWDEVKNGTYIGYTATPFANVFMSSDDRLGDGHGVDMYPDDFIYVMKTPDAYFGAERLFGISPHDPDGWEDDPPNVVREIPKGDKDLLLPPGKNQKAIPPQMAKSLEDAIKWFVVASAIRRTRGQQNMHSSMLVHTTHRTEPHFLTQKLIDDFLEPLRISALDDDVEAFHEVFTREVNKAKDLYQGDAAAPTWRAVSAEIPTVLRRLRTVVDNSQSLPKDRLDYTKGPQTVIVIGGGTLSRGLTLEGLFVSYFTRSSNLYDTLLQMGRWFGYRHGYEDLQRIWLTEGLDEDYRHLALVELDMREEIRRMISNGDKPKDITVRIRQAPGRLQITNPNKMKGVQKVETDFEGYRIQPTLFDLEDPSVLDQNLDLTKQLLKEISPHAAPESSNRGRFFKDVDFPPIADFVSRFKTDALNDELRLSGIQWVKEKLPETKWNVVLIGGSGATNTLEETGFPVKTVTRAPIKGIDPRFPHRINIRTLMTGSDYLIDLTMQGYKPESEKQISIKDARELRKSSKWTNGQGLLLLYPISRNSESSRKSEARQPMAEAFQEIGRPELAMPGDESKPLMACAMILPWDVDHRIKAKGTFVGVPRNSEMFDDQDDYREPMPEDREKDFS